MYVCMYVCMYIRIHICMYVCMCVCMCVCVCVCIYIYIYIHTCTYIIHTCAHTDTHISYAVAQVYTPMGISGCADVRYYIRICVSVCAQTSYCLHTYVMVFVTHVVIFLLCAAALAYMPHTCLYHALLRWLK